MKNYNKNMSNSKTLKSNQCFQSIFHKKPDGPDFLLTTYFYFLTLSLPLIINTTDGSQSGFSMSQEK